VTDAWSRTDPVVRWLGRIDRAIAPGTPSSVAWAAAERYADYAAQCGARDATRALVLLPEKRGGFATFRIASPTKVFVRVPMSFEEAAEVRDAFNEIWAKRRSGGPRRASGT